MGTVRGGEKKLKLRMWNFVCRLLINVHTNSAWSIGPDGMVLIRLKLWTVAYCPKPWIAEQPFASHWGQLERTHRHRHKIEGRRSAIRTPSSPSVNPGFTRQLAEPLSLHKQVFCFRWYGTLNYVQTTPFHIPFDSLFTKHTMIPSLPPSRAIYRHLVKWATKYNA